MERVYLIWREGGEGWAICEMMRSCGWGGGCFVVRGRVMIIFFAEMRKSKREI